jgi:hypothetical protein
MDDHDRRFTRPGDGPSDPMSSLLGALTDLLGRGMNAWRVLGPQAEGAASLGAMFPQAGRPGASADAGPAAVAQIADMSPAIAQAGVVAAASTLRYWRTLAELQARYQASLMQTVADRRTGQAAAASPADSRVLADELRAFLREVGDAAMQEARRLQHELEQVSESIAQVADQATPSPHYGPDHKERPHRRPHYVKE